jgi:hypothetical protein
VPRFAHPQQLTDASALSSARDKLRKRSQALQKKSKPTLVDDVVQSVACCSSIISAAAVAGARV